ncbi:hypothetical protein L0Y65_02995 [Candidatus Micrarchaeota archaeon]|nr:hypothetical protein [Candidatus Micrarchaeota archaeon]
MTDLGDNLLRNRDKSESKSYIVGLERGRIWAQEYADYFSMREYSELNLDELLHFDLPDDEERHFRLLSTESPLELQAYLRGWIEGVREIRKGY